MTLFVKSTATTPLEILLGSSEIYNCSIAILNVTGDLVHLQYSGLPANQPHDNKNFVAIWNSSVIPWNTPPLRQVRIPQNSQDGTVIIDDLSITKTSYIVGYSVGQSVTNICCTALIAAGGMRLPPTAITIGIESIGTNSIGIYYQTLAGYRPATYGNWIGLWKGYVSPYNAPSPLGKATIDSDATEGSTGINNVPLTIDAVYTLIYFTGKAYTTAAAILTFSTRTPG